MEYNRLALRILKTTGGNFLLFHSETMKPYKSFNVKIDGVNIKQVNTVKYLGMTCTFDSTKFGKTILMTALHKTIKDFREFFKIEVLCKY